LIVFILFWSLILFVGFSFTIAVFRSFSFIELLVYSYSFGLGITTYLAMLLGLLIEFDINLLILFLIPFSIILLFLRRKNLENCLRNANHINKDLCSIKNFTYEQAYIILVILLLIVMYFLIGLNILLPVIRYDGLNAYTALAAHYARNKSFNIISELYNFSGILPMVPIIYALGYQLASFTFGDPIDILTNYVVTSFSIVTSFFVILAMISFSKIFYKEKINQFFIVIVLLSIPVFVKHSILTGTEMPLLLYLILGFNYLLKYARMSKLHFLRMFALSNVFLLLTRFNALLCFFLLSINLAYLLIEKKERSWNRFIRSSIYMFLPLILASPWYIRNFLNFGNPVYPHLSAFFPTNYFPTKEYLKKADEFWMSTFSLQTFFHIEI